MPSIDALQAAFDLLPEPVLVVDRQTQRFLSVNGAACAALGYTAAELLANGVPQICSLEDLAAVSARLDAATADKPTSAVVSVRQRRKDGLVTPVEWHITGVRPAGADCWIVMASEASAGGLESRELGIPGHDPLTGLPDRRLFERRLDRALERARHHGDYQFAVCFIDLDHFKAVNDCYGHLVGDRVLCEAARRLSACVRPGDMAARFGGDEFTVLVDDLHDREEAMLVARRILDQLETPVAVEDAAVKVLASVGVAAGSPNYRHIDDLLRDADRAMYRVKGLGGSDCLLFAQEPPAGSVKPR